MEVPEPHNPWSNIGYWGDHRFIRKTVGNRRRAGSSGARLHLWNQPVCLRQCSLPLRSLTKQMLADWYSTIVFDWGTGRGGGNLPLLNWARICRLIHDVAAQVIHVTMVEKLLVLLG
ncbi:MAG: hypothetical protein H6669_06470 [Ardenticatenaceae bacterium]|nr:hypothetical protein [Ardenticatenaceae bacterium]